MDSSSTRLLFVATGLLASLLVEGCARAPGPYEPPADEEDEGSTMLDEAELDDDESAESSDDDEERDARVAVEADARSRSDAGVDAEVRCAAIRERAPVGKGVDVVFVVDSSGTMLHAVTQVQANIADFVADFEAAGADVRVVMITALDPARGSRVAQNREKYLFVRANVRGRSLYAAALDEFADYESFLRPTAAVHFVMVTSSDDAMSASAFQTGMKSLLGGRAFTQHAIASPDANGLPCVSESQSWNPLCAFPIPIPAVCGALQVGRAYNSLAASTGGEQLSVCKDDWGDVFAALQQSVIEAVPLPCTFLMPTSDGMDIDPEKVSMFYTTDSAPDEEFPRALEFGQCGDQLGWYFDDPKQPTMLKLCPRACETVAAGGAMDIAFGCFPPTVL